MLVVLAGSSRRRTDSRSRDSLRVPWAAVATSAHSEHPRSGHPPVPGHSDHERSTSEGRERRRPRPRLRRSRTPRSDNQDSSLLLQRLPAHQPHNLPDLVALGLPVLDLKVDEFGHVGCAKTRWLPLPPTSRKPSACTRRIRSSKRTLVMSARWIRARRRSGLHAGGRYGGGTTRCASPDIAISLTSAPPSPPAGRSTMM